MRILRLTTVILAFAGELCCWSAGRPSPAASLPELGYESVTLRRTGENHLFLFAQVNGRRRSCLVDTGWSRSTVSTNTAAGLGRDEAASYEQAGLNPPRIVSELKLGRVVLTNEPVIVRDLRVNGRPAPFNIVLGCDLLIRHHAILDCAKNRLYLRRETPSEVEIARFETQLRNSGWFAADLKRHQPLALTCAVTIRGTPVDFLVDSGAIWSCLDSRIAHALNLRLSPSLIRISGAGVVGEKRLAVADLQQVQIESQPIKGLSVAVLNLEDWGLGAKGEVLQGVGGILGGGELAALHAIIDCHRNKLWLRTAR